MAVPIDFPSGPAFSRRGMLRLIAAASAAAFQPTWLVRIAAAAPTALSTRYGFLTADELAILDAVTSLILPSDDRPGAREIGVVDYVQSLLSFFPGSDGNCDRSITAADLIAVGARVSNQSVACREGGDVNGDDVIDSADVEAAAAAVFRARPAFGGGPFSGRNPQPHFPIGSTPCHVCHGTTGDTRAAFGGSRAATVDAYPGNAFQQFLPLNRLQTLSWKLRLLGASAVPEVADNPLLSELPEVGLRQRYRDGLAALESSSQQRFGKRYVELTSAQRQEVLGQATPAFVDLLHRHVIQGTLCAPEYGGNQKRLGWQLVGFDGDSQPLGYEIYDEAVASSYRERPDKPNSGPNPNEDCEGFSPQMKQFLRSLSRASDGRPFADPYCFEADR